jgi:hypothetical protein
VCRLFGYTHRGHLNAFAGILMNVDIKVQLSSGGRPVQMP